MRQDYTARNRAELDRLVQMVEAMSEEDLSRPIAGVWTVSALLAHCAFWDQFVLARWEMWEREGIENIPIEVDTLNDAVLLQWLALPPQEAARQAVEAARAVDSKIESLPPDTVAQYMSAGRQLWMLDTAEHRREHLDEIERVLYM